MNTNKVNKVEQGNYVGYIWMSNENKPEVWKEPKSYSNELDASTNPFIVEGMLWDADREVSYSIKYVDGKYIAHRWDLNTDFKGEDYEYQKETLTAHARMGGKLLFRRYWHAVEDAACLGMKVLKPYAQVFVGFNDKKEA